MSKHTYNFYGCPEGLGNRFEEIARLSRFSIINNVNINYFWNNSFLRNHEIKFSAKNIEIIEINNLKKWPTKNFESSRYWREFISTYPIDYNNEISLNIPLVKPEFEYIGIHIRGTDRIVNNNNPPEGFQNLNDLNYCIESTIKYLENKNKKLKISVFSEDQKYKNILLNKLSKFEIIEFADNKKINSTYSDFFYLSNSSEIIMCSKFSTFALSAATLGKKRIIKFIDENNTYLNLWDIDIEENNTTSVDFKNINSFSLPKENSIFIGNGRVQNFKTTISSVKNCNYLISYNANIENGFEENFKLINKNINLIKLNNSIFYLLFKNFLRKLHEREVPKKLAVKFLFNQLFSLVKLFGLSIFKYSNKLKLKNLDKFFLITDLENFENFFFNNKKLIKNLTGALIIFNDYDSEKVKLSKVISTCNPKFFYYDIKSKSSNNKNNYLSLVF